MEEEFGKIINYPHLMSLDGMKFIKPETREVFEKDDDKLHLFLQEVQEVFLKHGVKSAVLHYKATINGF